MRFVSQRRVLGALFATLAIGFAGIGGAAGLAGRWVIALAAAALALWLAGLAARGLGR